MRKIRLLAADAMNFGTKGWKFHRVAKRIMRYCVNTIAEKVIADVIKRKKEKGFINKEVFILYQIMDEICERNEIAWAEPGHQNHDRRFYHNMRDIVAVLLDEDSYYLLRFFYFLELVFEREKEFRIEFHKQRAYWKWEEIAKKLKELRDKEAKSLEYNRESEQSQTGDNLHNPAGSDSTLPGD